MVKVKDLLKPNSAELKVRDGKDGAFVEGLTTCGVKSAKDIDALMEEGLCNRTGTVVSKSRRMLLSYLCPVASLAR